MRYLDIALKVVGDDLEKKEGQNQKDSPVNFSKTNCEKSELSEKKGYLDIGMDLAGDLKPKPYLDGDGDPVISADCDRRYIWWHPGGMSLKEIIEELKNERPTKQDDNFPKIRCEISELSEIRFPMDTAEDLAGTFQKLFEEAVAEVGACYLPGTLETIRADSPDLAREIQDAEDRINLEWLKAREGIGDLGIFKEFVERWRALHLKAIGEYHNSKHPSLKAVSKED